MQVDMKLSGVDTLIDRLKVLPDRLQKNLVTGGIRAGSRVIAKDAQQRVSAYDDPSTPNSIAKNIAVRSDAKLARKNKGVAMRVGVRGGAKSPAKAVGEFTGKGKGNPGGDTYYWRFLEFGTSKMSPLPFMVPAMNAKAQAAFDAAGAYMEKRLVKEIAEL